MGTSPEQWLDIGLNFAGFLIAGILMILLYSLYSQWKKKPHLTATANNAAVMNVTGSALSMPARNFEFINLGGNTAIELDESPIKLSGDYRVRDRQAILTEARKMLAQKKGASTIKRTLPITEGEFQFVKQNISLQNKTKKGKA
jgi:hypothetical protein